MRKQSFFSSPLSLKQWLGVCVLVLLIVIMYLFMLFLAPKQAEQSNQQINQIAQEFNDSIQQDYKHKHSTIPLRLHPFDPNKADTTEWQELGFKPWMARSSYNYRMNGGKFRVKSDLRRLYGMNDSIYASIEPYIMLPDSLPKHTDTVQIYHKPHFERHIKKDTIIELNSADTAQLKLIKGIGSYNAVQIVRYRQELGGYYSAEQLKEIKQLATLPDSLIPHFIVDTTLIKPLLVNQMKAEQLSHHPYLRYEKANSIYELRREKYNLKSLEDLKGILSDEEIKRLKPYLNFEQRTKSTKK